MAFNTLMHERNIYKVRPDFKAIAAKFPEFQKFVITDVKGRVRVDYTDSNALRALTTVLLKKDFDLTVSIPEGFLIPTVPQRLNYILWVEDMLNLLPKGHGSNVSGVDIGTGPCAIFSLLGAKKNGWNFIATETSDTAINYANDNIKNNNLDSLIKVLKTSEESLFGDLKDGQYDFCLCNPPFFEDLKEVKKKRLWLKESLAATAQEKEIISEGGETAFVKKMINESLVYKTKIRLYTSMFGRKKSYLDVLKHLRCIKDVTYTTTEFCQGNTIRWGIGWTFFPKVNFKKVEIVKPPKCKKEKPPLIYYIPQKDKVEDYTVKGILESISQVLENLQIHLEKNKCHENYAEIQLSSYENTWSHQRRKRRQDIRENAAPCIKAESNDQISVSETRKDTNSQTTGSSASPHEEKSRLCHQESVKDVSRIMDMNDIHDTPENVQCVEASKLGSISSAIDNKKRKNDDANKPEKRVCYSPTRNTANTDTRDSGLCMDVKAEANTQQEGVNEEKPENSSPSKIQKRNTFLLYSTLKLRKSKTSISLEMNCPPDSNRDSMYQIFQLLKNKLH